MSHPEYLWQTRHLSPLTVTTMFRAVYWMENGWKWCVPTPDINKSTKENKLKTNHNCETLWNSDMKIFLKLIDFHMFSAFLPPFLPVFSRVQRPWRLEQKMWWQFSQRSNSLLVSSWQIQHLGRDQRKSLDICWRRVTDT